MNTDKKLTILGHLTELRNRLIKAVIAVVITTIIAFVFADYIFKFLTVPLKGNELIFIDMTEMFGVYMKVCLAAGVALAMPVLIYQLIMFIAPALTPKEKKYVYLVLPWIAFMFIGGVAFSYFVFLPPAITFLFTFGENIATPQIRIGSYIDVVTRLMLITGIIFELPVVSTFLARLGIVNYKWLASKRKIALVVAFIVAAIVTPTVDLVTQCMVAAPLIVLYEMSIWLARLVQRKRVVKEEPVTVTAS